jgi:3-oxoacyl-(acyl-carrier-protein) synthase
MLVLESEDHARARGAPLLAEIAGYGASFDAADPVAFATDGRWYAAALRGAMAQAGVTPREIDAVIAEGRATPATDQAEANALLLALDGARPPITCSKGGIGHTFSAAGALDTICAVDMIRDGFVPPIANFTTPGVSGALDFVGGQGRRGDIRTVLLGARGLSGVNLSLVLRRVA